ncbi:MAG: type leader peptidase family protein [Rickettsiaceae bacterium]|jgi:leader peptidase (prepilin peptidase)/N-methyltransferase|nr:type leader peptidase family protein [Rickettsiaceae bacterium]
MLIYNILLILILGLCFGSFITMASHRFTDENISVKDFIFRNSFCPSCNQELKFKHLFPVISWFLFKGHCGFCAAKISIRYPIIEISTALLFLGIFFALGSKIDIKLALVLLISVVLMIMVVVDLEHYFIPDFTQISLGVLTIIYHLLITKQHDISYYILSSALYLSFGLALHYGFLLCTKKQGIGEDDIKFFAFAGLMLGIDQIIIFMILSGIIGALFGIVWMRIKKDETFPFAPALAASFLICLLFKINYLEWLGTLLYLFQKYVTKTAY